MDSEELSLSWSNHRDVLISVFDDLLSNNNLVDCTLAAEGQCLRAHKVVLSASSPYFQLMFSQDSEKHPIIFLKDVKFSELKAIIEFVYRGEVKIKENLLGEFLEVANSLQIRGLNGVVKNSESKGIIFPDSPPSKRKRKSSEAFFQEHGTTDSLDLPLDHNPANNLDQSSNQNNFLDSSAVAGSSRLESCDIPSEVQSEFPIVECIVKGEPEFDITEETEFLDAPVTDMNSNDDSCGNSSVPASERGPYGRASPSDEEIDMLEALVKSLKASRGIGTKPNVFTDFQIPNTYRIPGKGKVPICDGIEFYILQDVKKRIEAKSYHVNKKTGERQKDWSLLVREAFMEVYGQELGNFSAKGRKSTARPAVDSQLYKAVYSWAKRFCDEDIAEEDYRDLINKTAANKRRYQTENISAKSSVNKNKENAKK